MPENQRPMKKHVLTVDGRESLTAAGIRRVDFFSDELITAQTDLGQLNIKGEALHIETLDSETGDLLVRGKVAAVSYSEAAVAGSFLRRLFQ